MFLIILLEFSNSLNLLEYVNHANLIIGKEQETNKNFSN